MNSSCHSHLPVLGICGYSGAGKTTLIEKLIGLYAPKGFRIAVVKNDVHGLQIDKEGKDTDRFFKAGSDVFVRGPQQRVSRSHRTDELSFLEHIKSLAPHYDLILLEGHKRTPHFDKIWLLSEGEECCPEEAENVVMTLHRSEDRLSRVLDYLTTYLPDRLAHTPLYLGIVSNNGSWDIEPGQMTVLGNRMSEIRECFHQSFFLGTRMPESFSEQFPQLPLLPGDDDETSAVQTAMRWAPLASWYFVRPQDLLHDPATILAHLPSEIPLRVGSPQHDWPLFVDFRNKTVLITQTPK